jgi:hypothetical protein
MLCPLIHPPTKYQPKIFIRFEDRAEGIYYVILGEGHWVKVKGRINTNLSRNTPLSPDTSSHQISTKNLHSFRRYRAEGNFGFKVKSRIDTILLHDTSLSPDTSSNQISTKNLHTFQRYRAEGNYYAILGHWVKVKGCIDTD